jgi:hypothetical protein
MERRFCNSNNSFPQKYLLVTYLVFHSDISASFHSTAELLFYHAVLLHYYISSNISIVPYYFFYFRGDLACNIALDAVNTVAIERGDRKEIDIKNYAKVEKVMCKTSLNVLEITGNESFQDF